VRRGRQNDGISELLRLYRRIDELETALLNKEADYRCPACPYKKAYLFRVKKKEAFEQRKTKRVRIIHVYGGEQ